MLTKALPAPLLQSPALPAHLSWVLALPTAALPHPDQGPPASPLSPDLPPSPALPAPAGGKPRPTKDIQLAGPFGWEKRPKNGGGQSYQMSAMASATKGPSGDLSFPLAPSPEHLTGTSLSPLCCAPLPTPSSPSSCPSVPGAVLGAGDSSWNVTQPLLKAQSRETPHTHSSLTRAWARRTNALFHSSSPQGASPGFGL